MHSYFQQYFFVIYDLQIHNMTMGYDGIRVLFDKLFNLIQLKIVVI